MPTSRQDPGRHDRARVLLRALVAPLRIPARAVRRERNIAYGPAGRENQLDVYRHRSNPLGCPVLVYFHPGGFFSGRKSRESRALFEGLVRAGWVCISANYRLGRAGRFPNNLVDAKRAIAWIRAHAADYGVDSSTLVVCGGSAGAYLTAMCALSANDQAFQPSFEKADTSVSAAVGLYGFYGTPPGLGTQSSVSGCLCPGRRTAILGRPWGTRSHDQRRPCSRIRRVPPGSGRRCRFSTPRSRVGNITSTASHQSGPLPSSMPSKRSGRGCAHSRGRSLGAFRVGARNSSSALAISIELVAFKATSLLAMSSRTRCRV